MMFLFLWSSKQEYIKRDIMYRPKEKGGTGVSELKTKLNTMFLTPIMNAVCVRIKAPWVHFAKFWLGFIQIHPYIIQKRFLF